MSELDTNPITVFAKTNFRNQERVFGIKADDRRRHMYILGKTGMGKTNLLENLAIQDIQQGHGICFIDPHGDVALKLIKAIPPERINDVIYFDPADQHFPIAFNVLEQVGADQRSVVASGLVSVFKKIWADSWGPRLEYILRNAILALLEYPGATLLGVMRILVDKSYRERVMEKVTDPVVKQFWTVEFAGWNERVLQEVISPIQNKVGQFTSNSLIRNIIGQPTSAFDVRKIMDERKILIMNLAKGKIGEDSTALLGAMMVTKIQQAAMSRVDTVEEDRKDFYLYIDEFQNFATLSFANILSEARKYRLSLILANQYITQFEEEIRDAIFGNAGTIISFRVGAMDAEFLEKEFEPVFMLNDMVNLPKYQIYLKLMIDGIAGDAFSATTLPPILVETEGIDEKVIAVTRERYASSREEVEEKIRRWTGMLTDEEKQALRAPVPVSSAPRPSSARPTQRTATVVTRPAVRERVPAHGTESIVKSRDRATDVATPQPVTQPIAPQPIRVKEPQSPDVVTKPKAITEAISTPTAPLVTAQFEKPSVSKSPAPEVVPVVMAPSPKPAVVPAIETFEAAEGTLATEAPVEIPEKVLYPAVCATCSLEIEVPFVPDASRPTFCKDCLRDYQRAVARERNQIAGKPVVAGASSAEPIHEQPRRTTEHRSYVPAQYPLRLSQAQYIEPKKFKSLRRKPDINVSAVRALIDEARQGKDEEA
ncbi:MAG: CxxC-x17-CxxC domain-containing protein [Candidatus Moraniibacteriota bacterium]